MRKDEGLPELRNREQGPGHLLPQSIYVKPKESLGIVHMGVLLLGVILLITSFGLIMGGTTLRSIQTLVVDEDGYITSDPATVDISGYAIVLEDMEIDGNPMAWRWIQSRGGLLKLKIVTESNDPDKEIFIGVARESDIHSFLQDVEYQPCTATGWPTHQARKSRSLSGSQWWAHTT